MGFCLDQNIVRTCGRVKTGSRQVVEKPPSPLPISQRERDSWTVSQNDLDVMTGFATHQEVGPGCIVAGGVYGFILPAIFQEREFPVIEIPDTGSGNGQGRGGRQPAPLAQALGAEGYSVLTEFQKAVWWPGDGTGGSPR